MRSTRSDAIAVPGLGGGHDEREQTLNQLLVEMDGFESNDGVILMASTNRPDVLDPALLEAGTFRPPCRRGPALTCAAAKQHSQGPHAQDPARRRCRYQRSSLAERPDFTGADLANIVNEAALNAARYNKKVVTMSDFEIAKDKGDDGS